MTITAETGIDGFTAGLKRCGREPTIEAGVVIFEIEVLGGGRSGQTVRSGTEVGELQSWPAIPPHWVHLPADISFNRSNTQPSAIAGWLKHSRQIGEWGNAAEPVQAWLAHVRSVLAEAT